MPVGILPQTGNLNFSGLISSIPEFSDNAKPKGGEEQSDPCSKRGDGKLEEFEVAPHQRFVRTFMSAATPYTGMLLFHGLGSGKTCAAMQVAEETFNALARNGTPRRTFIVAAPNLQAQFKSALYDPEKLQNINGVWRLPGCVSSELLAEALPDPKSNETKESILKNLDRAVVRRYRFVGPDQLANMVYKVLERFAGIASKQQRLAAEQRAMTEAFGHRLYIIDEAHDLRVSGPGNTKRAWDALRKIAEKADETRVLLLTATPVFDTASDIISLLNLLLLNDGKPALRQAAFFTSDGKLRSDESAQKLAKVVTGYVSFVPSQDVRAFPYLLMPEQFEYSQPDIPPASIPLRGDELQNHNRILDLAYVKLSAYQDGILITLLQKVRASKRGFGHTDMGKLIMALNFVYPGFDAKSKSAKVENFIGDKGLLGVVRNVSGRGSAKRLAGPYTYDPAIESTYGDIFARPNLDTYSAKLTRVLSEIERGEGVVLVYSQYLESGAVPFALALEKAGYFRADGENLWDSGAGATAAAEAAAQPRGGYVLITGDKTLSPNNSNAVAMATAADNTNGEKVKVVLISQAGSQGVDLRNIRQVHLIDPWYNLGRAEQIIGRGRRRCSHAALPADKRNVSVYMYSTLLQNGEESPDSYIYNLAAAKAIEGGMITRALKEWAVDCYIQNGEDEENGDQSEDDASSTQISSNGVKTTVTSKPRPYSFPCDYQPECSYKCGGEAPKPSEAKVYGDRILEVALPAILAKLRAMFAKRVYYSREEIMREMTDAGYLELQVDAALTQLVNQPEQWVVNPRGVIGHVENIERFYMFVPVGLEGARLTLHNRLYGANTAAQTVEVEPPQTKLGTAKVYKESKDIVNKAARLFKRAMKELEFVAIEKGTVDIPWDVAARNTMTDERAVVRAKSALTDAPPLAKKYGLNELEFQILQHEVAMLPFDNKLMLLRAGAAGELRSALSETQEQALQDTLFQLSGPFTKEKDRGWIGTYAFGNMETGKIEFYVVTDDSVVRRATPQEALTHKSSRQKMNPPAPVHGLIAPHRKQYLTFKVVDIEASASQKGWQCGQASKRNVLSALNKVVGKDLFNNSNTKLVGSSRELCIDLEVILRAFQSRNKNDLSWIYTYEQSLLNSEN